MSREAPWEQDLSWGSFRRRLLWQALMGGIVGGMSAAGVYSWLFVPDEQTDQIGLESMWVGEQIKARYGIAVRSDLQQVDIERGVSGGRLLATEASYNESLHVLEHELSLYPEGMLNSIAEVIVLRDLRFRNQETLTYEPVCGVQVPAPDASIMYLRQTVNSKLERLGLNTPLKENFAQMIHVTLLGILLELHGLDTDEVARNWAALSASSDIDSAWSDMAWTAARLMTHPKAELDKASGNLERTAKIAEVVALYEGLSDHAMDEKYWSKRVGE